MFLGPENIVPCQFHSSSLVMLFGPIANIAFKILHSLLQTWIWWQCLYKRSSHTGLNHLILRCFQIWPMGNEVEAKVDCTQLVSQIWWSLWLMTSHYVSLSMNLSSKHINVPQNSSSLEVSRFLKHPRPESLHSSSPAWWLCNLFAPESNFACLSCFETIVVISEMLILKCFEIFSFKRPVCKFPMHVPRTDLLNHWIRESIFRVHVYVISPCADWK